MQADVKVESLNDRSYLSFLVSMRLNGVRAHAEKLILVARWTGGLEQLFQEVPDHGYFQLPYSSRGMVSGFEWIRWCTEISNLVPIEGEWFS